MLFLLEMVWHVRQNPCDVAFLQWNDYFPEMALELAPKRRSINLVERVDKIMKSRSVIFAGILSGILSLSFKDMNASAQGALASIQCSNIFSVVSTEHSITPNFGYFFRSQNYSLFIDASNVETFRGSLFGAIVRPRVYVRSPASRATISGSLQATNVSLLYAPGSSIPYGFRVTQGVIPVQSSARCFPEPGGGGSGGGGGGGTCQPTYLNNYCAGVSSLVSPSSVVSRGTIGFNDSDTPKVEPFDAKEPEVQLGEWEGKSWQPEDQG